MQDYNALDMSKLYSPEAQQIFANVYDNLMLASKEISIKSVLVCAADPGEGATTVALGLGLAAAAQRDRPILLIDGNFHSPGICQALRLQDLFGLGELITGRVESHQAVIQKASATLHAMGPGIMPSNHFVDLEPPKFTNLLTRLAQDYGLVIVDGPPLKMHPESVLYGSQVDQALLVVYSGVTRVPVLSRAISKLMAGNCKKVDILLNRRIFPIPEWIYNRL